MAECASDIYARLHSLFVFCVNCFGTDARKHAQLSGQRANGVCRSIHGDADDGQVLFPVGDSHTSDDEAAVFTQQVIQLIYGFRAVQYNADQGDPGFHKSLLLQVMI